MLINKGGLREAAFVVFTGNIKATTYKFTLIPAKINPVETDGVSFYS